MPRFVFSTPYRGGLSGIEGHMLNNLMHLKDFSTYITLGKLKYFINLYKYLGYIPFISPLFLLAFPIMFLNLLFDEYAVVQHTWHSTLIIPFIFVSLIWGIAYFRKLHIPISIWLFCFMLFFGAEKFEAKYLKPFIENNLNIGIKPGIFYEYSGAQKCIPENKSIFTNFVLLPNLSNRERIFWIDTLSAVGKINTDYLFISLTLMGKRSYKGEGELIDGIINSGKYESIYASQNFKVYVKK